MLFLVQTISALSRRRCAGGGDSGGMFSLQREVFADERLMTAVAVVNAAKARRKTKGKTFLCLTGAARVSSAALLIGAAVKRNAVAVHRVKVTDDTYRSMPCCRLCLLCLLLPAPHISNNT